MDIRGRASEHLHSVILPFWKSLRDHTGFFGEVGHNLEINQNAPKGVIMHSRILWFFSKAFSYDTDAPSYAAHAFRFLKDYAVDREYGGLYWSLTHSGAPLDTRKHTYNMAFAIYACAAYYMASGDESALGLAMEIFNTIEERCAGDCGYSESFGRDFSPLPNEKLCDSKALAERGLNPVKTMNTVLHIMEAYTELLAAGGGERVETALRRVLGLIGTKIYDPKNAQLGVFFDEDYNVVGDIYSCGHDIEAAWLIDRAVRGLCDSAMAEAFAPLTSKLASKVLAEAYDGRAVWLEYAYGVPDKTRIWWVQAEAVTGFYNEYRKYGDIRFLNAAESVFNYILEYVADKRPGGEWLWGLDGDDVPLEGMPVAGEWKCPYHNGRMIIELLDRALDDKL